MPRRGTPAKPFARRHGLGRWLPFPRGRARSRDAIRARDRARPGRRQDRRRSGLRGALNGLHVLLRHRRLSISRREGVCRGGRGLWRPPRLTSGSDNIAIGHNALVSNTTGSGNVATGTYALPSNSTGNNNVATGDSALLSTPPAPTTSPSATPRSTRTPPATTTSPPALMRFTRSVSGSRNLATGRGALYGNALGDDNVASGYQALVLNFTGSNNVATGNNALFANPGGNNNLARRLGRPARQHHRIEQHRPRRERRPQADHRLEQRRDRQRRRGRGVGAIRIGSAATNGGLHRRDQRHDPRRSGAAGGRQLKRQARGRAGTLGVAREYRRAARRPGGAPAERERAPAARDRPASRAAEGRLIDEVDQRLPNGPAGAPFRSTDLASRWDRALTALDQRAVAAADIGVAAEAGDRSAYLQAFQRFVRGGSVSSAALRGYGFEVCAVVPA